MTHPVPLLLISDDPSAPTGLGRICRDLATRIHANLSDVYRLGVAGMGGTGSCKFGWTQYHLEGVSDWIIPSLPEIVEDFAGKERCIVLPIWDAHRLSWFSQPQRLGGESLANFPRLQRWLMKANIERWIYAPIDSSGPNDKLSFPIALTLLGFDRILAYGQFGEDVIRRTLGDAEASKRHLTNLPHGIDSSVFYERDRSKLRNNFLWLTGAQSMFVLAGTPGATTMPIQEDEILVGMVCTNQSRKDLPLSLECCSILARDRKLRIWLHTDKLEGNYSIPSLLCDYGLQDRAVISLGILTDDVMAQAYSACDLTIGPGSEGFGFPLLESQYCGTPVVTGAYAGGADIVPKEWQVSPDAFRYEGSYACKRPVYLAWKWAAVADHLIGKRCNRPGRYNWNNLWPNEWEPYFRKAAI